MAQKKQVYKEKLTQVGYWNYEEVYNMLYNWLKDHGYKLYENKYREKLSSAGKEVIILWESKKKITDYFLYKIELEWHILTMKDAEVEVEGKKTKTNKGELEIVFKGIIVKDYEKRWEDKPFYKFLRGLYEQYVIRTSVDEYEDDLEDQIKELITDLKALLRIPVG
ncbi:hypothetical protein HN903_01945 [archaeon]|jgi:hypothetical protein|nr:hypothetical protein [archaeon]MBT7128495.1 hypothetical protein [archaeon]